MEGSWNHEYFGSLSKLMNVKPEVSEAMNLPKIEFITYIYILYYQSSISFQLSPNLTGFSEILN